jgi:hypothetical protein
MMCDAMNAASDGRPDNHLADCFLSQIRLNITRLKIFNGPGQRRSMLVQQWTDAQSAKSSALKIDPGLGKLPGWMSSGST